MWYDQFVRNTLSQIKRELSYKIEVQLQTALPTSCHTEEYSYNFSEQCPYSCDVRDLDPIEVALDLRDTTASCHRLEREADVVLDSSTFRYF